jgi:hypothetical protein
MATILCNGLHVCGAGLLLCDTDGLNGGTCGVLGGTGAGAGLLGSTRAESMAPPKTDFFAATHKSNAAPAIM